MTTYKALTATTVNIGAGANQRACDNNHTKRKDSPADIEGERKKREHGNDARYEEMRW